MEVNFFFIDTATTEIYTLSLHDALPISTFNLISGHIKPTSGEIRLNGAVTSGLRPFEINRRGDRKSTRLNSSHMSISYAVFCLKKKIISAGSDCKFRNRPALVPIVVATT